ncbi:replicative DNA helicase [Ktedonobacter sp. SOSP1-85]|uniref:replicative DNA helicase n=1 Tax=Ktedonobacter sp. SOSP1-85 TaxID=2778367 RepID=UPI0019164841|nr:replicative DNA helicase [Ktedonobacter sp. SOSP1-85]GHO72626.1 replicative DNA helicase [Ktedonobacter sp. SOSP1-85]
MVERLPPSNLEAEAALLGSLIIDPEAIGLVADILSPDDFYRQAHSTIYEAILTLYEQQEPADLVTLYDELSRRGKLDDVVNDDYITSLVNIVPTSGNVEYYGRIIARTAQARRLIHAAGQIAATAYEDDEQATEKAEQLIFSLSQKHGTSDFASVSSILSDCITMLEIASNREGKLLGVPTGFNALDVPLGGLQPSDLIILAARPAVGKTSFALNVAYNAAYHHQQRVAVFSLEMSKQQLGMRLLSIASELDQQRLRMGWIQDEEWEKVSEAAATLTTGSIWIDDTAGITPSAMRSKARRLQAQQGVDLIIVDYLQLMHVSQEKRTQNREQEIAEISRNLKALAKELNVPVLALAQLSRAVESRQAKIPQLSDLRESGAIENDADVVLFIYREELYNPDNEEARNTADIIIAKHRNGPVGTVRLAFNASQTRFSPLEVTSMTESEE